MTGQINTREFEDKGLTLNSDGHTHHGISGLVFYASLKMYLLEKTLILGKIEDKGRKAQQTMRWLDSKQH